MSSGRKTRYREAVNKQTQSVGNGVCVVCCARCGEGGMQWYLNRALSSGSLQTPDASAESSVNIEKREGKKKGSAKYRHKHNLGKRRPSPNSDSPGQWD